MRELHWHPNAGELNHCLAGEGQIGVFASDGSGATFAIQTGSVTFVPIGYIHYIRNTGADPLHVLIAFTNAEPEHIDLSFGLPAIPQSVLAETFGLDPGGFPFLPSRGDQEIVPIGPFAGNNGSAAASSRFTVLADRVEPTTYLGGTAREIGVKDIPALEGITVFPLHIDPFGLREPHWHPNANELNYCISGSAQFGVVAPDGNVQTFVIGPGGASFMPQNWLHYIANVSDEPLKLLVFFGNVKPNHIDLSQTFDFFPPEIIAASFGVDPSAFASLPKRGDVFIAAAPNPK
jgi:oxalate decarboxylase